MAEESSLIPGSGRLYVGGGVGGGGSGLASPQVQVLRLLLRDGQLLRGPAGVLSSTALLRARRLLALPATCGVRLETAQAVFRCRLTCAS